jgi:hypothetical protein
MKSLFGGLIEFEDQLKLSEFLEKMDNEMSLKIIEGALEYGIKNGIYGLDEAYCIYKSLTRIKFCIDNYGNGFKTSNTVPDVEFDEDKQI